MAMTRMEKLKRFVDLDHLFHKFLIALVFKQSNFISTAHYQEK